MMAPHGMHAFRTAFNEFSQTAVATTLEYFYHLCHESIFCSMSPNQASLTTGGKTF